MSRGRALAEASPEYRQMFASAGGYATIAKHGAQKLSQAGVRGQWARYERQVDPDSILPLAERRARAEAAMRANMRKLALARHNKARKAQQD
jgi:hypothetical protein